MKGILLARLVLFVVFLSLMSFISASCGGGRSGAILTIALLDELFGTERSSIYVDNAVSRITLSKGEEFQLRIIHRQIRQDTYSLGYGYGRYYYEEDVTEESDYYSSNPNVASVSSDGLITAISPGRAVISVKFDLLLQKADQTSIEVIVLE